ncbi:MAG: IS21 family transposase [Acetobacteraceae bacterium]
MAQQRLSVRKVREILRLHHEQALSARRIAAGVGCALSTVQECLRRATAAGIGWPLPAQMDEAALLARLYPPPTSRADYPLPDWAELHAELARKGVTRFLLWQEYKATHPEGLQYTAFCNHYRRWLATQSAVLRQAHAPGDKLFVDYAGPTVAVLDRHTGEERQAQIFVAVLGCSNYTFAEATWTQALPDWLGSHVRALEFFGGAPAAIVPDNLKSGVLHSHRYEPDLNPAYQDFAEHYGLAILPTRVRKPRDKAKVEGGVLIAERWILARLRHQTFFSLGELNAAIGRLLSEMNARPFKKLEGCRQSWFDERERPALRPLPVKPYAFARWKQAKVHPDYHIEVERAYYSVPYKLIHQRVDVRLTDTTLEVFHQGVLIAAHPRAQRRGEFVTLPAHRPAAHQAVIEQSHARLLERATAMGAATAELIRQQAYLKRHPEQTLRTAQGILRLAADFSPAQLEAACERALELHAYSYRAVRALMTAVTVAPVSVPSLPAHPNVRGPHYFQ